MQKYRPKNINLLLHLLSAVLSFKYSSYLYHEARQRSVKVRMSPSLLHKECVP